MITGEALGLFCNQRHMDLAADSITARGSFPLLWELVRTLFYSPAGVGPAASEHPCQCHEEPQTGILFGRFPTVDHCHVFFLFQIEMGNATLAEVRHCLIAQKKNVEFCSCMQARQAFNILTLDWQTRTERPNGVTQKFLDKQSTAGCGKNLLH